MMLEASTSFVNSPGVQAITERALAYLRVGYPINLSGPAGTGKTTLAFHIAAQMSQPVTMIHGDDEFGSSDLIGRDSGFKKVKVVDNYIHTVLRTEEELRTAWQDNRLTTACRHGYTLIYDEFTRSKPEANNALLSVLEEKLLNLPRLERHGDAILEVHPDFRAIFTSNPEEYAGVHRTQDALMDRLITIQLGHFGRETEVDIAARKSGLPVAAAEGIVDLVRGLRGEGEQNFRPTVRACIAIARVSAHMNVKVGRDDPLFRDICCDVLATAGTSGARRGHAITTAQVEAGIQKAFAPKPKRKPRASHAKEEG